MSDVQYYLATATTTLRHCRACVNEFVAKDDSTLLCDLCRPYVCTKCLTPLLDEEHNYCPGCAGEQARDFLAAAVAADIAIEDRFWADYEHEVVLRSAEAQRMLDKLAITGKLEGGCRRYGYNLSFVH